MDIWEDIQENPLVGVMLASVTVGSLIISYFVYSTFESAARDRIVLKPAAKEGDAPPTVHLPLVEKEVLSHDTRRFRFGLPSPKHTLGLPVGQHISLRYTDEEGKVVMRSYTPVSLDEQKGFVDLVVKVYFKNVHPKFPEGGKMSQHLDNLKIGETIEVSGPKGKLTYQGKGKFSIRHRVKEAPEVRRAKKVIMIAGGSGITPMFQILRYALLDAGDKTEFHVLYANQTEDDILLRQELDAFAAMYKNMKIWYTIDRDASPTWQYSVGFVNAAMIKEHMPEPSSDVQVLLCGPPPMLKFAVLPALEELGFQPNQHFAF